MENEPFEIPTINVVKKDFSETHSLTYIKGMVIWLCPCMPDSAEQLDKIEHEVRQRAAYFEEYFMKKPYPKALLPIKKSQEGAN